MSFAPSRRILAATLVGAVLLAGCGSSGDNGGTTNPTPAISIALSSGTLTVVQGTAGNVTVNLTRSGGFTGDVSLAVTGLPVTGVTVSAATISAGATSAILTFAATATAAAGNSTIVITASGSGVTATSATLALTVNAATSAGSYTLSVSPASPSLAQGAATPVVITVNRTGGFAGAVTLSVTGAASGLTAALAQTSVTGATDTLTLTASATATAGTQNLTVKGTATGLTDQSASLAVTITVQTSSGNVTWQFCGTLGLPIWVAAQDGTGAWAHLTGTNNAYTFNVTNVGGIAYVDTSGANFDIQVFYGSKADLQGRANEVCNGAAGAGKTVTAPVAGTSAGDLVLASLGPSAGSGSSTLTFKNVPNGNLDLIAGRTTLTINQVGVSFNLAKMIIRRNLNPATGSALATIDFGATEAFTPVTKNLTINNLGTDVSAVLGLYFTTNNNTFASYFTDFSGGGASRTYPGVPAANQAAGDLHILALVGVPSLTGSTPEREALFAFHTAADETFALGPALNTPTVSTLTATGYARLRAAITVQPEYNKVFTFQGTQTGAAPRSFNIQQTAGYSNASSLNLDLPDFSGVSGFDVNWGPKVGTAVTSTVSAFGFPGNGITQPAFAEGASFMFASRPGTITP